MSSPEPWLRGPMEGVHPLVMPVFFSFAQVREDLAKHTAGLSDEQVWTVAGGVSVGFELKHIAGSIDRITTYLLGGQLSEQQLARLRQESTADCGLAALLAAVDESLRSSEARLLTLDLSDARSILEPRTVGRQALPTTVIGLLVHLAEHTQRHLGQAITLSKIIRQLG
jgi:uncharacterized damage-inducible protein DinB